MKRKEIRKAVKLVAKLAEYGYDTSEKSRRAFEGAKRKYKVQISTFEQFENFNDHVNKDIQTERERREAVEAKLSEVHRLTKAQCLEVSSARPGVAYPGVCA